MKPLHSAAILCAAATLVSACRKTADNTMNYTNALNAYYVAHPACLWDQVRRFPVQVGASDDAKTRKYDALVDQGLLVRSTSEKKVLLVSKREIDYDLSADGHGAWTPDPNNPGYGTFCYAHGTVGSIDGASPNDGRPGATTTVNYHYTYIGVPPWAQAQEVQTAFPQVQTDLASDAAATATLVDTAKGWKVKTPPSGYYRAAGADDSVVQ